MEKILRNKKVIAILIIVVLIAAIYSCWKWYGWRKFLIDQGLASPKFPFKMYSEEELARQGKWPVESPSLNAISTRTTPEQTYAIFLQALIDGDLDKAAECFVEEEREEWKNSLYEIRDKGYLQEMLNDLPKKIENVSTTGSSAYHDYEVLKSGTRYSHIMTFEKDWNGDWKIERL